MSLDIIHPRNQGASPEAGFIETWADRKLRRERERAGRRTDLPRNAKTSAKQYDPEFERKFRRLYASGMKYERIAVELCITERGVGRLRLFYNLPYRTDKHLKPSATRIGLSCDISKEMDREITRFCDGRYRTRADFIRAAIRQKLDGRP